MIQGSDEWKQARLGKVTASRIADLIAKTKTGWGASRKNYAAELIAERLTGTPTEGYTNAAMQWGTDTEPQARAAYEFFNGLTVAEIGFVDHPKIKMAGASPDGLIGDDGLIELKCPNTSTHIDTLLSKAIADKYIVQMLWQMACTGRAWCDFCSFDPRMPEHLRLFTKRLHRDDKRIAELESQVREFLAEIDETVKALNGHQRHGRRMSFQPRAIALPTIGESTDFVGWGAQIIGDVKLAETADDIRAIIDLNRDALFECGNRAPRAWASIDAAMDKRREQIKRGLPWSDQ